MRSAEFCRSPAILARHGQPPPLPLFIEILCVGGTGALLLIIEGLSSASIIFRDTFLSGPQGLGLVFVAGYAL